MQLPGFRFRRTRRKTSMNKVRGVMLAVMAIAFIMTSGAVAKDKNHHSVVIPETLQVGASQLAPGEYTMEWNESGSMARVNFVQRGKSLAQASAKIINLGHPAKSDSVTMKSDTGDSGTLEQIQFGGHKEAFSFSDSPSGE
jgi:hypothetical protein